MAFFKQRTAKGSFLQSVSIKNILSTMECGILQVVLKPLKKAVKICKYVPIGYFRITGY